MKALGILFLVFGSILVAAGAMALRLIRQPSSVTEENAAASVEIAATSDAAERRAHDDAGSTAAANVDGSKQPVDLTSRQS